jgi:hypothetical protein
LLNLTAQNELLSVVSPEIEMRSTQVKVVADVVPALFANPGIAGFLLVVPKHRMVTLKLGDSIAVVTPMLLPSRSAYKPCGIADLY